MARSDKLVVKGHGSADGEYSIDLADLINIGTPGALNILEQNQLKVVSGVRPADLPEAFAGLDAMAMVALAQIIIGRNGKTVRVDNLTQGHLVYREADQDGEDPLAEVDRGILYLIDASEEEDDAVPPAVTPSVPSEPPSTSGGESTSPSSEPAANDPSPTGAQGSLRSVTSDPETLAS